MKTNEFINKCVDYGYEWAEGEHDGNKGYFVRSEKLDTKAHFSEDAIENNDWPALHRQIIQGKDVQHVTRVVGYYSKIENWNKSKVGELADRQKGRYDL
ncbi:MAG: hypothetical protein V2A72_01945 [Candidatus Omnitrophota bacterium]